MGPVAGRKYLPIYGGESQSLPYLLYTRIIMKESYYHGKIAGIDVTFAFRHTGTCKYFEKWLNPVCDEKTAIRVPERDIKEWTGKWGRIDDSYTEFGLSVYRTSDHLLAYERCAFHAAAILWHERAFLFTAPSGTGKSTQLKNWIQLYPADTKIMNGDKPILGAEKDTIWVFPSPWKGKERLGDDSIKAPLGGIIFLRQSDQNKIRRLDPYESVALLLERFLCTVESEQIVQSMCRLEEKIISSVPVWKLENTGDLESTRLVHDTLIKEFGI